MLKHMLLIGLVALFVCRAQGEEKSGAGTATAMATASTPAAWNDREQKFRDDPFNLDNVENFIDMRNGCSPQIVQGALAGCDFVMKTGVLPTESGMLGEIKKFLPIEPMPYGVIDTARARYFIKNCRTWITSTRVKLKAATDANKTEECERLRDTLEPLCQLESCLFKRMRQHEFMEQNINDAASGMDAAARKMGGGPIRDGVRKMAGAHGDADVSIDKKELWDTKRDIPWLTDAATARSRAAQDHKPLVLYLNANQYSYPQIFNDDEDLLEGSAEFRKLCKNAHVVCVSRGDSAAYQTQYHLDDSAKAVKQNMQIIAGQTRSLDPIVVLLSPSAQLVDSFHPRDLVKSSSAKTFADNITKRIEEMIEANGKPKAPQAGQTPPAVPSGPSVPSKK